MSDCSKNNDAIGAANRGNPCESSLCTLCRADCKGRCETWLSSLKGRKVLYPRDFGAITAGSANTVHVGVSYNSLRINGYLYGANPPPQGLSSSADDCVFPNVSVETEFGQELKTKCRVPLMTGALGSTFIAAKYWDSFSIGAALVGFPIVVGENVVGVDREAVIENGRIVKAPELDRRIATFLRYHDGHGAIIVQMNVEDSRNGVAEYLIDKYGDKVIMELKWGQGAKVIGGEIQVNSLDYARFLKDRGYIVDPDPTLPEVVQAFESGAIKSIARHSRLGYTDRASVDDVRQDFMDAVEFLRGLGFERISLKTGSYGMEALAMAIRFAADAKLDLLTIDGSGGGTGMSPWNMMESWGVPSLLLHAKAYEYAATLERKGIPPVDMAFAGGLAKEDQIFKSLALGAPYSKLVCMGPRPDDSRLPRLEHRGRAASRRQGSRQRQLGQAAQGDQGDGIECRGDLRRLLRRPEEGRQGRDEEHPVRRDRRLDARRQARRRSPTAACRRAKVHARRIDARRHLLDEP